jgi:hypothetical protein
MGVKRILMDDRRVVHGRLHPESAVGEAAEEEAVWAPMEESENVPMTVVEEAEPWSSAHRHGAEEVHSLQAPLVEEPKKVAAVEVPDGAGSPARAWYSV